MCHTCSSLYWTKKPYLPVLMIRHESTHLVGIPLILIKTTLHVKFKGLLQWASVKQTWLFIYLQTVPPRAQLISCYDLSNM